MNHDYHCSYHLVTNVRTLVLAPIGLSVVPSSTHILAGHIARITVLGAGQRLRRENTRIATHPTIASQVYIVTAGAAKSRPGSGDGGRCDLRQSVMKIGGRNWFYLFCTEIDLTTLPHCIQT
jgi:hypothetical protein